MPTYSLTLRQVKGSRLTIPELDNNFLYLQSLSLNGATGPQGVQGPAGVTGPSGVGTTPDLAQVLAQGQFTGANPILSNDNLTSLYLNDGSGVFGCVTGDITDQLSVGGGFTELTSSDNATSEVSYMEMQPTQTQFNTIDTTGNLYSQFTLRGDYTILTYIDNDTSQFSELLLNSSQSILTFNIAGGVNNVVDVNANQAILQFDDVSNNGIQSTFLASQNSITVTFNDITADVQTGLYADVNNTQIYFTNNTTPIENKIKVDADGYYLKDVPAHDDNAAAITAGLTTGYIFKTTGSGAITTSGVLCIVE